MIPTNGTHWMIPVRDSCDETGVMFMRPASVPTAFFSRSFWSLSTKPVLWHTK